jgi:hypothetical protein
MLAIRENDLCHFDFEYLKKTYFFQIKVLRILSIVLNLCLVSDLI